MNQDSYDLNLAWDVINEGISSKVFPGAQVVIVKDDNIISLSNKGYGPITKKLRETLLSIQLEEIADPFDWIYPVTD